MITNKTVFVLGAGASQPYGFPVGVVLFDEVVEKFAVSGAYMTHVTNCTKFTETQIKEFVRQLRQSGMPSADAFLERRPEFGDLGKVLMATALILCERFDVLWNHDWMRYVYERMVAGAETLEAFCENDVSFVTFNYDRSLETFLVTSLMNTYNKTHHECGRLVIAKLPIIHLHGHLGPLPWEGGPMRTFGAHKPSNAKVCHRFHEGGARGNRRTSSRAGALVAGRSEAYLHARVWLRR